MTRPVPHATPPASGAYAVTGPQRTDSIAGSLRRAYTKERALPADLARLIGKLDTIAR